MIETGGEKQKPLWEGKIGLRSREDKSTYQESQSQSISEGRDREHECSEQVAEWAKAGRGQLALELGPALKTRFTGLYCVIAAIALASWGAVPPWSAHRCLRKVEMKGRKEDERGEKERGREDDVLTDGSDASHPCQGLKDRPRLVEKLCIPPRTFGVTLVSFLGWSQMGVGARELGVLRDQLVAASGSHRWQFRLSGRR